jgi:serine/threonine protein kinase/Flp pilus assembly protein TadD
MKREHWEEVERLYHTALEREPATRAAFLDEACAGDTELRRDVAGLLDYDDPEASFIQTPAIQIEARALAAQPLPDSQTKAETSPPGVRHIGAYQLLEPLGRGGMGEVHLALDTRLGRKVAVKLLPAEFTTQPERVRRFAQEAHAASALNHPNIITIHEIGEAAVAEGGTHYIVTEYVEGQTLRERMVGAPQRRLKLVEALELATQIAAALAAAHAAGITHRDIKPENVMVRNDGIVKVLDFGLAKLTEPSEPEIDKPIPLSPGVNTETGIVMGTPRYMSPEQARGERVDARTDIFSLGVLIYEMLIGRAPFAGATTSDVIAAILKDEAQPLSVQAPEVPPELERIVSQALRKNRAERYQNTKDLLTDLKDLKQELEFAAKLERTHQPSVGGGARHTVSRIKSRWRSALLALAALVLIIAGLTVYHSTRNASGVIDSIAVLPFANQNHDPEADYLADGLTESIINNLTQLPELRVIARNSVFRYKDKDTDMFGAGRALGVRAVVVGRVLQRGEQLMISAELVDVRENKQLWGHQYNRKLADVFAVQDQIAREITENLRLKLSGAEQRQFAKPPTQNLKAYQNYMLGRKHSNRSTREDLIAAIGYHEKAIAEDHNYALAYAGLANAYAILGARGLIPPQEGRRKAEEAARRAVALDDNLAEAHAALGLVYIDYVPFNFSLSDREVRRAIELSPSLALAHFFLGNSLSRQGRQDEALAELLKARELDPLSSAIGRVVATPYYLKRDYVRALEVLRQAEELGPAFTTTLEAGIYIRNGLFDEALAGLEKAKLERKNDPILIYCTGLVYAAREERAEALRIINELEQISGASLSQAHWIAKIYATLGEKELALEWLERGLAAGAIGVFYKDDPVWDPLRSEQRFANLLRQMGIP